MARRGGFSLLEIVLVCAIMAVLFMIAGTAMMGVVREAREDAVLMEMDEQANQALGTLGGVLKRSVLPISAADKPSGLLALMGGEFDVNGDSWRRILEDGTSFLAYVLPVDHDGDGDVMDKFGNPELGVTLPTGRSVSAVPAGELVNEKRKFCPGLAELDPESQLGLSAGDDVDLDAPALAGEFVFPASAANPVYGVVRFAPFRENGAPVILEEAKLRQDLNGDGDLGDSFALGHLELNWPRLTPPNPHAAVTEAISGESVLLQINRDDVPQDSIFQLGDFSPAADILGSSFFSLKVNLLFCNYLKQRDSWEFGGRTPFLTRTFQTVVKLRLMSIR